MGRPSALRPPDPRSAGAVRIARTLLLVLGFLGACTTSRPPAPTVPTGASERGVASWYGPKFHGRPTASGERYDMHGLTAAHRTLPFGTVIRVRNLDNGREITVRVNDRGPFVHRRVLDLSYEAARRLDMIGPGTARIEITVLGQDPVLAEAGPYTVQVGAFREAWRAEALRDELRPRFPDIGVRSQGPWHRVQLGPFDLRATAQDLRRELLDLGYTAIIVGAP